MENHEIPQFAATVGVETLEILWDHRCWISADVLAERDIIKESAKKMLTIIKQYKPHPIVKSIGIGTQYLSIITIEDGLNACVELLSKSRFHGNLGSDPRIRKIIQMVMGEIRYGRKITEEFVINNQSQRKIASFGGR